MEKEILFRISRPYKIYATKKTPAVQIPSVEGDITILTERAPTLFLLGNGVVRLLDRQGKATSSYFVKGGVADVARNRCAISSEKVVAAENIDVEKAVQKRDSAIHEEDKIFYQMVIDKLKTSAV